MTGEKNLITDPEVLLERFEIRRGSGGNGQYRGGDGVIQSIRFLKTRETVMIKTPGGGGFGKR